MSNIFNTVSKKKRTMEASLQQFGRKLRTKYDAAMTASDNTPRKKKIIKDYTEGGVRY